MSRSSGTARALATLVREWITEKKVPARIGLSRAFGTGLLVLLVVQGATGSLLSLCYAPTPDHAYDSIRFIDEDVAGGRLLRGMHYWGASAIVCLAAAHVLRVFWSGAYKAPRQGLWVVGLVLLAVILGFGFTGYLLPWDQKAYWATSVGLSIAETAPVVGPPVANLLRGGPEVGALTLSRMFALHVVFLPAILAAATALHLFLVHRLGITAPGARVGEEPPPVQPFFPDHVFREVVVGGAAVAVVAALGWILGPPLEAPASPDAGGYDPRPDWYFLGLFQLLKYFEGPWVPVATVGIPGLLCLGLLLLPFVDRNPERRPTRRPVAMAALALVAGAGGTLTVLGVLDPGSRTTPPERLQDAAEPYVPPPSPPFEAPHGLPPDPEGASAGGTGAELVESYDCLYCHTLGGRGNELGSDAPAFEDATRGKSAEHLDQVLVDPQKLHPGTEMPSAADLGMPPEDRERIVRFLLGLTGE